MAGNVDLMAEDRSASVRRVVAWSSVLGIAMIAVAAWLIASERRKHVSEEAWAEQRFGLRVPIPGKLDPRYADQDHDLIADPPAAEHCLRPETLVFSYIAGEEAATEDWRAFLDRMSAAVGRPVTYQAYPSVGAQLQALERGELHITALNTGSVPRAVNVCGFVPVSVKANRDANWQISMKLIVPRSSPLQEIGDLRGKAITFTNPSSFSGFKFAVVMLQNEFGLRLGKDYEYRFSTSHFESLRLAAARELTAAVVASDLLAAAYADGSLPRESVREVYTSEPFPAAAFGYGHQLAPEIAAKVREFLGNCDLSGSPMEGEGAAAGGTLVSTNYRNDWEAVRAVDASIAFQESS